MFPKRSQATLSMELSETRRLFQKTDSANFGEKQKVTNDIACIVICAQLCSKIKKVLPGNGAGPLGEI